jgi:hypothetical protein
MPAWAYAGYSFGAAGVANFLADKVAANANLKGLVSVVRIFGTNSSLN